MLNCSDCKVLIEEYFSDTPLLAPHSNKVVQTSLKIKNEISCSQQEKRAKWPAFNIHLIARMKRTISRGCRKITKNGAPCSISDGSPILQRPCTQYPRFIKSPHGNTPKGLLFLLYQNYNNWLSLLSGSSPFATRFILFTKKSYLFLWNLRPSGMPAVWGVSITLPRFRSSLSVGSGSDSNTSRHAPEISPFFNASIKSLSLTIPPRAVLIKRAVFFIFLIWGPQLNNLASWQGFLSRP